MLLFHCDFRCCMSVLQLLPNRDPGRTKTNLCFLKLLILLSDTTYRNKGVGGGVRGVRTNPPLGTTKINSQEFCMCSATVVLSGLPGTGPVGYHHTLFRSFLPNIKWSQFGHSSKRIFSKKLSASGGLRPPDSPPGALPLDLRWGLHPRPPLYAPALAMGIRTPLSQILPTPLPYICPVLIRTISGTHYSADNKTYETITRWSSYWCTINT